MVDYYEWLLSMKNAWEGLLLTDPTKEPVNQNDNSLVDKVIKDMKSRNTVGPFRNSCGDAQNIWGGDSQTT